MPIICAAGPARSALLEVGPTAVASVPEIRPARIAGDSGFFSVVWSDAPFAGAGINPSCGAEFEVAADHDLTVRDEAGDGLAGQDDCAAAGLLAGHDGADLPRRSDGPVNEVALDAKAAKGQEGPVPW